MQPTPADPDNINTVRVRLVMWCFITLLLLAGPWLATEGNYGWVLFAGIPMSVGILSSLLVALKKKRGFGALLGWSLIPAAVVLVLFMVLAREGFICILMATPLLFLPLLAGVGVGYAIQDHYWSKYVGMAIVFVLNTAAYVGDRVYNEFTVVNVQETIVIDAPPAKIWEQLTTPFEFGDADNFFLENGVSFPQAMQLQSGNGCNSLFCKYNNGTMTATIDSLVPERVMQFSFHEPPVSMVETSLYSDVEPNHIRGRILIDHGSFRLVPQSDGSTKLIAATQFRHNIGPQFYWSLWATYLMQQTHSHVLEKIKESTEERNTLD